MFLNNRMPDQVVIFCPGPGAVNPDRPSSLVHVNSYPFLGHVLGNVKRCGITDIVLITAELGQEIERVFGDGGRFGLQIKYFHDPDDEFGPAGAIRAIENWLKPSFFTLDGSRYLVMDFESLGQAFIEAGMLCLMTVWENIDSFQPSNCLLAEDDRGRTVVARYHPEQQKGMRHAEYGACVFRDDIIDVLPDGYSTLAGMHQRNALRKRIAAYAVRHRFYDVQTPQGLRTLRSAMMSGAVPSYVHLL